MLIINADDWGRSRLETNAALACINEGRVTSVSAMVFMDDSERAAELANARQVDVGLHLNFDEHFTSRLVPERLREYHGRTCRYLARHKFSQLLYNPALKNAFRYSYQKQCDEFSRVFGR